MSFINGYPTCAEIKSSDEDAMPEDTTSEDTTSVGKWLPHGVTGNSAPIEQAPNLLERWLPVSVTPPLTSLFSWLFVDSVKYDGEDALALAIVLATVGVLFSRFVVLAF